MPKEAREYLELAAKAAALAATAKPDQVKVQLLDISWRWENLAKEVEIIKKLSDDDPDIKSV